MLFAFNLAFKIFWHKIYGFIIWVYCELKNTVRNPRNYNSLKYSRFNVDKIIIPSIDFLLNKYSFRRIKYTFKNINGDKKNYINLY